MNRARNEPFCVTQTTVLDENEQPLNSTVTITVFNPKVDIRVEHEVSDQYKKKKKQAKEQYQLARCEYFGWKPDDDRLWWSHTMKTDNKRCELLSYGVKQKAIKRKQPSTLQTSEVTSKKKKRRGNALNRRCLNNGEVKKDVRPEQGNEKAVAKTTSTN